MVRDQRVHVHPDRWQPVTADEETDLRISDHELMMQDIRDGRRTAARILSRFILAAIALGIFMYITELIEGTP